MNYSLHLLLALATLPAGTPPRDDPEPAALAPDDLVAAAVQGLLQLAQEFRQQPVSPLRTQQFEQQLQEQLRGLGRRVVQWTYNRLEPADVPTLGKNVHFEASSYTRLNR